MTKAVAQAIRLRPTARRVTAPLLFVTLTANDLDIGIVPAAEADALARRIADESRGSIALRHPLTDKVLRIVRPTPLSRRAA